LLAAYTTTMNLFERLYSYREKEGKNDRENFLTELLAGVLRSNPSLAVALLTRVGLVKSEEFVEPLVVETQTRHPEGIPDLTIRSPDSQLLLLIECKVESGEGGEQLSRYETILDRLKPARGMVLYLTKYYEPSQQAHPRVCYLRWYEVYQLAAKQPKPMGEILAGFKEYLVHHSLHHPMSFTTTDLLALESIRGTIRTMDEVLISIEQLVRESISDTNQKTATRSGKLHEGWYGMRAWRHGITFEVGFWSDGGQPAVCFFLIQTSYPIAEPTTPEQGGFQYALRKQWGLPTNADLRYLELTQPITTFLTGRQDGTDVQAMRTWFVERMQEFIAIQKQYPLEQANKSGVPIVAELMQQESEISAEGLGKLT
jgi:hypothetical protein